MLVHSGHHVSTFDRPAVSTVDHDAYAAEDRHYPEIGPVTHTMLLKYFTELPAIYQYTANLTESIQLPTQNGSNQ